jgi:hypothetical protein
MTTLSLISQHRLLFLSLDAIMEALAGLGLAANILQVIDFSSKLLSVGHQVYQKGSSIQNEELELVINDFNAQNNQLKSWARPDPATLGPLEKSGQVKTTLPAMRNAMSANNQSGSRGSSY